MNSLEKAVFGMATLGVVISGLTFSGCSHFKNKNPETLSRQDKDSVAAIEQQKASGDITGTEAALAKDSVRRDHILKF